MPDSNEVIASVLELLQLNQDALAAAVEEVALWLQVEGAEEAHENIQGALQTLTQNAGSITSALRVLRREA